MTQDWNVYRTEIAREFAEHPNDYLRQPTFMRTLHPPQPLLARRYYEALQASMYPSDFQDVVAIACDTNRGNPHRYQALGGCSMVALQHAWQLRMLHVFMDGKAEDLQHISEIGGGYGDMCRQIRGHGYRGSYRIFDFSELHAVQRAYLPAECGAEFSASMQQARLRCPVGGGPALLLATFSVSEMRITLREQIEPAFQSYGYLMFSWNPTFDGIDNSAWFAGLAERLTGRFDIQILEDQFMRAWYLLGRRL